LPNSLLIASVEISEILSSFLAALIANSIAKLLSDTKNIEFNLSAFIPL